MDIEGALNTIVCNRTILLFCPLTIDRNTLHSESIFSKDQSAHMRDQDRLVVKQQLAQHVLCLLFRDLSDLRPLDEEYTTSTTTSTTTIACVLPMLPAVTHRQE